MKNTMIKILLILCCSITFNGYSQTIRTIDELNIINSDGNEISILALVLQKRWTLIILNENLTISQNMLNELIDKKTNMENSIILVFSQELRSFRSSLYKRFYSKIAAKDWATVSSINQLTQLNLVGTPMVYGIDNGEIKWQISGFSSDTNFNTINNRINRWSNK